jgi:hypothetical protein
MIPESMSRIQADVPWDQLAVFLNTLFTPDMCEMDNGMFFAPQLPEDLLIRGYSWSRFYYPPEFFAEVAADHEWPIDFSSTVVPRAQRCLWLGRKIAEVR